MTRDAPPGVQESRFMLQAVRFAVRVLPTSEPNLVAGDRYITRTDRLAASRIIVQHVQRFAPADR